MVYRSTVWTVTRAQSKVQKRENSMWACIQGVYYYSVQGIGIGGVICYVKYENIRKGRKSKRNGKILVKY